jgi:hypothetical protein
MLMPLTVPEGTIDQQLATLSKDTSLYALSFFSASLTSLPLVVMLLLLGLHGRTQSGRSPAAVLGVFLLAPYLVMSTASYVSQYTIFPRLLADLSIVGRSLVKSWYYNNPDSVPYMLDSIGFALFGLSALAIGAGLMQRDRLGRAMAWLLLLSGLAALAGFTGYVIDSLWLEIASVGSGLLTLPLAFAAILWSAREIRARSAQACD